MQILGETIRQFYLQLFAYCLMDNHFHLFVQTPRANLDRAMQNLQGQYAHYLNLRYSRVGSLFQGRYKSPLVTKGDYSIVLTRYIHQNPMKAGLIRRCDDYTWSSYPCYSGKLPKWEWLETEWILAQFNLNRNLALQLFEEFHYQEPSDSEKKILNQIEHIFGRTKRGLTPFKLRFGG